MKIESNRKYVRVTTYDDWLSIDYTFFLIRKTDSIGRRYWWWVQDYTSSYSKGRVKRWMAESDIREHQFMLPENALSIRGILRTTHKLWN